MNKSKSEPTHEAKGSPKNHLHYTLLNSKSQTALIYRHMYHVGGITQLQATYKYGITRLSVRIADLREQGVPVLTDMQNRNGKRFAVYRLEDDYVRNIRFGA